MVFISRFIKICQILGTIFISVVISDIQIDSQTATMSFDSVIKESLYNLQNSQ